MRLTPEGSQWFWAYQRAVTGPDKLPPNEEFTASGPGMADWEPWIKAKLA